MVAVRRDLNFSGSALTLARQLLASKRDRGSPFAGRKLSAGLLAASQDLKRGQARLVTRRRRKSHLPAVDYAAGMSVIPNNPGRP